MRRRPRSVPSGGRGGRSRAIVQAGRERAHARGGRQIERTVQPGPCSGCTRCGRAGPNSASGRAPSVTVQLAQQVRQPTQQSRGSASVAASVGAGSPFATPSAEQPSRGASSADPLTGAPAVSHTSVSHTSNAPHGVTAVRSTATARQHARKGGRGEGIRRSAWEGLESMARSGEAVRPHPVSYMLRKPSRRGGRARACGAPLRRRTSWRGVLGRVQVFI